MQPGRDNNNLPMSEINVTPLVDVMLVLLIIFMLAAPHLNTEQGVDVQLPEVTVAPLPEKTDELIIKITKEQAVYLDDVKTPLDKLEPVLREAAKARSAKQIYVRADKDVPYGFVVKVMAAARKAGIEGLGLVTEPERIKPP